MDIIFRDDIVPDADAIAELYNNAGLPRPTHDKERIKRMFENSDVVITAWDNESLVGVSRTLSDFCWCSYLADLAVRQDVKAKGIGKKLIELTKEKVGKQSMILLLSVPDAMEYYPKVGFEKVDYGFIIHRTE